VAALWPQAGLLEYYDPLGGKRAARSIVANLARWLQQDAADKGVGLPCTQGKQLQLQPAPHGMPVQVST
jgi:hypothetical protein